MLLTDKKETVLCANDNIARLRVQDNNNSFILSIEPAESVGLHSALVLNKVHLSISTFRRLSQVKSVWNRLSLLCLPQGGSSSSGGGGGREDSTGGCQ